MVCTITRRASFSASYYYRLPGLSQAANEERFGKHARSPGATFWLWVTIAGPVDEYGMVANLSTQVKRSLRRYVLAPLDGSALNSVWDEFSHTLPTPEWIAHCIWHRLKPHLNIVAVGVSPQDDVRADYYGDAMDARLTIRTHFSAAHRLGLRRLTLTQNSEIYGKCARPSGHGHNYKLAVTIQGKIHPQSGMVVDLKTVQKLIEDDIVEELDHRFLNTDIPRFSEVVPTAENIALYIRDRLEDPIKKLGATLYKIELHETDNNSCEVYGKTISGLPVMGQTLEQSSGQHSEQYSGQSTPDSMPTGAPV